MVLDCLLYQIISRSFSNDIRFNKKGEVNIPYGDRNYCDVSRIEELKNVDVNNVSVFSGTYIHMFEILNGDDFVFIDPPYYSTTATYNNGWTETNEKLLYKNLDYLSSLGIKWMLTNTVENRGNVNEILKKWLDDNKDKLYTKQINGGYGNSSFRKSSKPTVELMVTNYPMK
jgi:site-specific DNA-adenine methylase